MTDLAKLTSRQWQKEHGVCYVLPWRIEDQKRLAAEFEAVAREARNVPGHWICDHCGFVNIRSVIHPGGISVDPKPPPPCPNDERPMRPMTWEEIAKREPVLPVPVQHVIEAARAWRGTHDEANHHLHARELVEAVDALDAAPAQEPKPLHQQEEP